MGFRLDTPNPVEVSLHGLRPMPLPPDARARNTSAERQVFCPHYTVCLDVAARNAWEDFTCRRCPVARDVSDPSADQFANDRPGPRE